MAMGVEVCENMPQTWIFQELHRELNREKMCPCQFMSWQGCGEGKKEIGQFLAIPMNF